MQVCKWASISRNPPKAITISSYITLHPFSRRFCPKRYGWRYYSGMKSSGLVSDYQTVCCLLQCEPVCFKVRGLNAGTDNRRWCFMFPSPVLFHSHLYITNPVIEWQFCRAQSVITARPRSAGDQEMVRSDDIPGLHASHSSALSLSVREESSRV